jgi:hypothetical protein
MNWVQYEVWAEEDGHQELIETTASRKEALALAKRTFNDGADQVTVYEETADGDYAQIEQLSR